MTIDYASEKLWEAVHNLAIGRGRIKERLRDVREVIGRVNTERVDLSPSFQAEYDALIELVAKATATSASHETGYRAAKEILRLAYKAREIVQTERGARRRGEKGGRGKKKRKKKEVGPGGAVEKKGGGDKERKGVGPREAKGGEAPAAYLTTLGLKKRHRGNNSTTA